MRYILLLLLFVAYSVQANQDCSRVTPIDLTEHEESYPGAGDGGHTIFKHVGKSYEVLKKRTTFRESASSFVSLQTANKYVAIALCNQQANIRRWVSNPLSNKGVFFYS